MTKTMSRLKVIDMRADSDEGFEAAAQNTVTHAAKSVRNVTSVHLKEMKAAVENDRITSYGGNAKVTFLLDDQSAG